MIQGYGLSKNAWAMDTELSHNQLRVLLLLSSLTAAEAMWRYTPELLANWLGLTVGTVRKAVRDLGKREFVVVFEHDTKPYIRLRAPKVVIIPSSPIKSEPITDTQREMFEFFHKSYKGKKRGLETELKVLRKHKDWRDVLSLLRQAHQNEVISRRKALELEQFVPDYQHMQTWLNQRSWEKFSQDEEAKEEVPLHIIDAFRQGLGHMYSYRRDYETLKQKYEKA